jgi:hypothetical protein
MEEPISASVLQNEPSSELSSSILSLVSVDTAVSLQQSSNVISQILQSSEENLPNFSLHTYSTISTSVTVLDMSLKVAFGRLINKSLLNLITEKEKTELKDEILRDYSSLFNNGKLNFFCNNI